LEQAGWRVTQSLPEADAAPQGFWDRGDALKPMRLIQLVQARIV